MTQLHQVVKNGVPLELAELAKLGEKARREGHVFKAGQAIRFLTWGGERRLVLHPKVGPQYLSSGCVRLDRKQIFVPHNHPLSSDTIFVVSGRGRVQMGDTWYDTGPGEMTYVPPRVQHAVENTGDEVWQACGGQSPLDMDYLRLAGVWP